MFTIVNIKPCENNEIEMTEIKDQPFVIDSKTSIASWHNRWLIRNLNQRSATAAQPETNPLTTRHGSYSYHSVAIS
jgi:hypothetical protein